jgi:hypothetical protein
MTTSTVSGNKDRTSKTVSVFQNRMGQIYTVPAIADTTQGNTTTVVVDSEFRKLSSHFAQNVHKMKSSTPASVLTFIQENKLRNQENKRTILRDMQNQIASCGLLTMMLGQRAKPEPTVDNPTGFEVGRSIIPEYNSAVDDTVALYCTYRTYRPYSLSPYRILIPDTASSVTSFSRHIVISLASVASYPS